MYETFLAQISRGQAQEGTQLVCCVPCALMCFNPAVFKKLFEQYKRELERLIITSPEQIWNCDETGCQDVPESGMLWGRLVLTHTP